ncbi:MAG: hypothetical protein GX465_18325, partial [Acidobacteria bacterium]|nr:hypothetical protein [Acidobacteriota bacterium]
SDQTIRIRAYVGGTSAINFGVPVKLDTNAAGMTAGINSQIPYVIQCTSETDAGVLGIITPCSHITYNKSTSTNHWYAAVGDLVEVVLQGVCRVVIGDAINTTTALYGPLVSAGTNGVVACPAASSYTIGKLLIHNASYAYGFDHEALMYVERSVIPALPDLTGYMTKALATTQTLTDDGAITIPTEMRKTCILDKATAIAATLADPAAGDEGKEITIISKTDAKHTVTFSTGLLGLGTSGDVATFGGAILDSITVRAQSSVWVPVAVNKVTIG